MSLIAEDLIPWQVKYGRHFLPWQNRRDPYAVWLSEIMLQQTQVKTVIPYYQRFIEKFPDVENLAQASVDDVLALWSGLGYYARARNLHQAAREIIQNYKGIFPQDSEKIQQLPGIGRSTAAAITVFAYGNRAAILDGNVKRVFARYFGIDRYPGEPATLKKLWALAEASLPENNDSDKIRIYTQALMDLGSMICVRHKPACSQCPLISRCVAYQAGSVAQLPVSKPKKQIPVKETVFMIYRHNHKLLLEKRSDKGIWGGLWCFPEYNMDDIIVNSTKNSMPVKLPRLPHAFTHFKLWIQPCLREVDLETETKADVSENPIVWVEPDKVLELAIPAPVRKLIQQHFIT
ncbi:A/G-specific adenine glycosylase [Nitrosomonas aestuarii]|uniref:A/G-specific adenine glycosylase n=1 Tax=Nitrosomonas aestuarii TaxID=52441 RepID=UPI000D30E853|nr:A/G-specific adenine glycosylase [Nitrosomonas aestuarii]PTN11688.1 A/G-specific DNA-adenine glycosylase [Nitrosomonas aestuarii]